MVLTPRGTASSGAATPRQAKPASPRQATPHLGGLSSPPFTPLSYSSRPFTPRAHWAPADGSVIRQNSSSQAGYSPLSSPRKPTVAEVMQLEQRKKEAAARLEAAKLTPLDDIDYDSDEAEYWGLPKRAARSGGGCAAGADGAAGALYLASHGGVPTMPTMPDAFAWRRWAPGMRPGDLPPPAVAAMADEIAKAGHSPSTVITDLRSELADGNAAGFEQSRKKEAEAQCRLRR